MILVVTFSVTKNTPAPQSEAQKSAQEDKLSWAYFIVLIFVLRIVILVDLVATAETTKLLRHQNPKHKNEHNKIGGVGLILTRSFLWSGLWSLLV